METFLRRPLPDDLVAFGSTRGRAWLTASIAEGTAEAFFPLMAHLHTQSEPTRCGLGTLVTVLNALEVDPGRVWKGPWRFFGEEMLICCKPLEEMALDGLSLLELGCLAECNGGEARCVHADRSDLDTFRRDLLTSVSASSGPFLVANYARGALGQTGTGHFSPIAAWHQKSDHVLVLDVARFKYPPHWVPVSRLWEGMVAMDPDTQRARGYLVVGRAHERTFDERLVRLRELGAAELIARARAHGESSCPRLVDDFGQLLEKR